MFIFFIFYFLTLGTVKSFLYWVFYFPLIAPRMPGYVSLPSISQSLAVLAPFVLFIPTIFKKPYTFFLIVAVVLIVFAYPRFDYFHLIPTLAITSIVFGPNISYVIKSNVLTKAIFLITTVFLCLFILRYIHNYWQKEIRFFEPEITSVASFMSIIIPKDETVYIQNGPDQLIPLSGHLPPKPWADEFPWYMEIKGVQERVIEGINIADTKYVIFQPYLNKGTYDLGSYKPTHVVDLIDKNFQNLIPVNDSLWLKIKK